MWDGPALPWVANEQYRVSILSADAPLLFLSFSAAREPWGDCSCCCTDGEGCHSANHLLMQSQCGSWHRSAPPESLLRTKMGTRPIRRALVWAKTSSSIRKNKNHSQASRKGGAPVAHAATLTPTCFSTRSGGVCPAWLPSDAGACLSSAAQPL